MQTGRFSDGSFWLFGAVLHSPECGSYDNGGPADRPRGLVLGDLEADRSAKPWYFMGLASRPILVVCAMGILITGFKER